MSRSHVFVTAAIVIGLFAAPAAAIASPPVHSTKAYANCTALNKDYPHGVAKKGASDKTSGKKVTTFEINTKVYKLNTKSDRDKDGIACEKK